LHWFIYIFFTFASVDSAPSYNTSELNFKKLTSSDAILKWQPCLHLNLSVTNFTYPQPTEPHRCTSGILSTLFGLHNYDFTIYCIPLPYITYIMRTIQLAMCHAHHLCRGVHLLTLLGGRPMPQCFPILLSGACTGVRGIYPARGSPCITGYVSSKYHFLMGICTIIIFLYSVYVHMWPLMATYTNWEVVL
jgi:hypothetical protein